MIAAQRRQPAWCALGKYAKMKAQRERTADTRSEELCLNFACAHNFTTRRFSLSVLRSLSILSTLGTRTNTQAGGVETELYIYLWLVLWPVCGRAAVLFPCWCCCGSIRGPRLNLLIQHPLAANSLLCFAYYNYGSLAAPRDSTWAKLINELHPLSAKSPRSHTQTLHAHRVRRANFNFISRSERRFQNGLIICVWPLMWWGFGELMGPPWAVPIKKRAVCMWVREHRQIQISVVAQPRESRISASRCVPACAPQLRVERLPRAQFARARERATAERDYLHLPGMRLRKAGQIIRFMTSLVWYFRS